jgi:hypothetical protein
LNDKIKNYKNFDRRAKKNNKKSKEKRLNWNHYYHWKNKNYKFDLRDQIASHKNFDKRAKEKILKIKSKRTKFKISYNYILQTKG